MIVKPLYVVGTQRHVGKTTMCAGLAHALSQRGLRVGYMKPLGQRFVAGKGNVLHDDALLVANCLGPDRVEQVDMAVPLPPGRVEHEVANLRTPELIERVVATHTKIAGTCDLVIVEGMGNVAMGSCLGLSGAEVCQSIGARAFLVSGGGIGRAIDEISLCATFLEARGADLAGVVVNKVWPEKYARIKKATTRGLMNLGIQSFGTVPFEQQLASPQMSQVFHLVGGELIGGREHLGHRVAHTIIAAMETEHMLQYIQDSALVITPGDRIDNILACLRLNVSDDPETPFISGLVLTGNMVPGQEVIGKIKDSHLPVIAVKEDTCTTAHKIIQTVFKILPDDHERIKWAIRLVGQYVDLDGVLDALAE